MFNPMLRYSFWPVFLLIVLCTGSSIAQQSIPKAFPASAELTTAERAWIAADHTVRVRVANYPPYQLTKPVPSGIAVDYLSDAAKRYGFKIELVPDEGDFASAAEDVRTSRRRFDLLLTFTRTAEREKQFAISVDYLTAPWVVYARRDSPYIIGLESLDGKTVAAEMGFLIGNKIKADYPAIRILEVPKSVDALVAVATGQADAYVGNLANASYLVKVNRLDNLVVTAPTRYGINTQAMAIRNDWPELAGLIDKGIAAMTLEERNAISRKWGDVEFKPRVDYTLAWQVVAVASLVLLAFLYWNRRLAREIVLRKEAERSALESATQLEAERNLLERRVIERTARLSAILQASPIGIVVSKLTDGAVLDANDAALTLYGYTRDEAIGRTVAELNAYADLKQRSVMVQQLMESGKIDCFPINFRAHNGEIGVLEASGRVIELDGEKCLLSMIMDVTERKRMEGALADRKQELERLYDTLSSLREDERRRVAREMHDELGHLLTVLRMDADWVESRIEQQDAQLSAKMKSIGALVEQIVDSVRRIMEDLRPPILDELGLVPAIEHYVAQFAARSEIRCNLSTSHESIELEDKKRIGLFRIVQEALNNVSKHANATQATIRLERNDDTVILVVEDNGTGLPDAKAAGRTGFGLTNMQERASMLNGRFSVSSSKGQGVRIEVVLPT